MAKSKKSGTKKASSKKKTAPKKVSSKDVLSKKKAPKKEAPKPVVSKKEAPKKEPAPKKKAIAKPTRPAPKEVDGALADSYEEVLPPKYLWYAAHGTRMATVREKGLRAGSTLFTRFALAKLVAEGDPRAVLRVKARDTKVPFEGVDKETLLNHGKIDAKHVDKYTNDWEAV